MFYRLQPICELGLQFLVRSRLASFCASEVQNIFRTCRFHVKCLKAGPGVQENRRNEPLEAKSHRWPTRATKNDKTQTLVPHLPRANPGKIWKMHENAVPCLIPCNLDAPIDFTLLGPRPKFSTSLGQLRQSELTPTVRVLATWRIPGHWRTCTPCVKLTAAGPANSASEFLPSCVWRRLV